MRTTDNFNKFFGIYKDKLTEAVLTHNGDYGYPVTEVPVVAGKMKIAFIKKSFNKDGRAIKATCKQLGIKHTYRDIEMYLGENEI